VRSAFTSPEFSREKSRPSSVLQPTRFEVINIPPTLLELADEDRIDGLFAGVRRSLMAHRDMRSLRLVSVAFGCIADMAGPAVGSTRSRLTQTGSATHC
jgi:hypothetical protein